MKLFGYDVNINKRSGNPENPGTSLADPASWLLDALGMKRTNAGVVVSEEGAMSLAAVYSCVKVLSEDVAGLPFVPFRRGDNDSREIAYESPVFDLLVHQPNPEMTPFTYHQTCMYSLALWGNFYAIIMRNVSGNPTKFTPVHPASVTPKIDAHGRLIYDIIGTTDGYIKTQTVMAYNMIHVKGLTTNGLLGNSVIRQQMETIGLGLAQNEFGAKFFSNGANMNGALTVPGKMTDKMEKNISNSWKNKWSGLDNAFKTPILEQGMKYERIGIPPEEAQFIQSRKYTRSEISGMYRVPPHMISDLEKSTFSNIEHQGIEYVVFSLRPYLVNIAQEYNRKLFIGSDRRKYYTEHNVNALMQGDADARSKFYKSMFNMGTISINEIRKRENLNSVDEGNNRYMQMNMTTVENINNPNSEENDNKEKK